MHAIRRRLGFTLLAGALLAGCTAETDRSASRTQTDSAPQNKAEEKIAIRTIKRADLENVLKENKGKVVVLNLWAMFCVPCKEEIPEFVALQKRYAPDGLVFILLNTDDPDDPLTRDKANAWLNENQVALLNLAPESQQAMSDIQAGWDFGGLPQTFIYDREGKLAKEVEGKQPAMVEQVVQALLGKK